jgi:hypothetical protein
MFASAYAQNARIDPGVNPSRPSEVTTSKALKLKWDESVRFFEVAVPNEMDRPLEIFGAQTTPGLYIVDYPNKIPPRGKAAVGLVYAARPGTGGSADLLRLLTDHGERLVQIDHEREEAVRLGTTSLQWLVGEPGAAKEVTLSIPGVRTVPKGVRVGGVANKAELLAVKEGEFRLVITPGSTSRPGHFPVFVDFERDLPGVAVVIFCSVVSEE